MKFYNYPLLINMTHPHPKPNPNPEILI